MDFFEWLPDQFNNEGLEGLLENESGGVIWDDYYPGQDSFIDIQQRNGSTSSTDESYQGITTNEPVGTINVDDGGEKGKGRPRVAYSGGRDPVMNRIQRRRTQNRNSQRIYRQRRIEERQRFEARALAAEEASKQLRLQLAEMHTMIGVLKHQLQQAKSENDFLRGQQS